MFNAAKSLAALTELLASVSTNLSIALVLGLAALPVLPHDYAPVARASAPAVPAPVEVVRTKPVPTIPAPLRPNHCRRPRPARPPTSRRILAGGRTPCRWRAAPYRAERRSRGGPTPPVRTDSAIATEDSPTTAPSPPPVAIPIRASEPPNPMWVRGRDHRRPAQCLGCSPRSPPTSSVEAAQHDIGGAAPVALRRLGSWRHKIGSSPRAINAPC